MEQDRESHPKVLGYGAFGMRITCCNNCVAPKRYPGCHGTCPEYLEQRAELDKEKEAERKWKEVRGGLISQRDNAYHRIMKNYKK